MKCPKCDTEIFNNLNKCPNCGASLSFDDDFNIDLPLMKKEEATEDVYNDSSIFDDETETKEYTMDFTQDHENTKAAVATNDIDSVLDDYDDKMAEIDKEIEKVQSTDEIEDTFSFHPEELDPEGDDKEVSSPTVNDILEYEPELPEVSVSNDETTKTKKNYLLICGAIALIILALTILGLNILRKNNSSNYDYKSELSKSLDRYYNTNGEAYDSLTKVLEHVYKEQNKLDSVREETNHRVESWIKEYINVDAPTAAEFSNTTTKYKTLVDNLYNKVEVNKIKILEEDKYKEYSEKIETISQDSKIYYRALDAFNKEDYNEAYLQFSKIEEKNNYYEKATSYKSKIINTVISFIKKDINRLEGQVEEKSDAEKLVVYKQIVDIVQKYDKTYKNLGLSNNETYNEYLTTYRNKVSELSQ